MLTLHRRHTKKCEHASKGWNYTLCGCPIWCDGAVAGVRLKRSLQTSSWEKASRRLSRLERGEEQDFMESEGTGRLLSTSIAAYLEDAKQRNLKPNTLKSYKHTLTQLSDFIGKVPLSGLTIEKLVQFRARQEMSPRTQRKEIEYLRALCAFCVERKWLVENPAKLLKAPRVDDIATHPYSAEEIDRLLVACNNMRGMWKSDTPFVRQRCRALVLTMLYSGLRVGDVAQLRRASLEPSGHLVLRTMKTGVPLKLLLNTEAATALRALPAPSGNPTYFFWSGNGKIETCSKVLWRTVYRVGKVAKVHAHPHRFRDTFAVELLTNGADIRTVQQLLGHESVKTTEKHYAHFVAAHQKLLDSAVSTLDFRPKNARPLLVGNRKK